MRSTLILDLLRLGRIVWAGIIEARRFLFHVDMEGTTVMLA